MMHALILAGIGTAVALAGTIAMWNLGSQWYSIALTLTDIPSAWLGARLVRPKA